MPYQTIQGTGTVSMIIVPPTQEAEERGSLEAKEFRASLGNTARRCFVSFASRDIHIK